MTSHGGARPGAGRKPGKITDANLNIRIPQVELDNAKEAARDADFTFSEWVREALRRMMR